MKTHAFTSFTFSYLNRARVLARTLRRQHPDWVIWAIVTDKPPGDLQFDWANEPFDRILSPQDVMTGNIDEWLFGHNIVEACTAIKAATALKILDEPDCRNLLYFDPDIAIFNSMDDVLELLESHAIILTPHQTEPATAANKQTVIDNEICSLIHGSYNLGFLALSNTTEAKRFCNWWADRLKEWCHDRKDIGLFVDQKWCDLVPSFFEGVKILRDPGYNVASWNLEHRKMAFDASGCARINGRPLRFFHFTKLGPVGDTMTHRYAGDNFEIFELWAWYKAQIDAETETVIPRGYWHYGSFDNGENITDDMRRLYRDRSDLSSTFENPRQVSNGFYGWLAAETDLLDRQADDA